MYHLLCDCESLAALRVKYFNQWFLQKHKLKEVSVKKLESFIMDAGIVKGLKSKGSTNRSKYGQGTKGMALGRRRMASPMLNPYSFYRRLSGPQDSLDTKE